MILSPLTVLLLGPLLQNLVQLMLFGMVSVLFGVLSGPAYQASHVDLIPLEKRGRLMHLTRNPVALISLPTYLVGGYLYGLSSNLPFYFLITFGTVDMALAFLLVKEPEENCWIGYRRCFILDRPTFLYQRTK